MKKTFTLLLTLILLTFSYCENKDTFKNNFQISNYTYNNFKSTKYFKQAKFEGFMIAEPELAKDVEGNITDSKSSMYFDRKDCFGNEAVYTLTFYSDVDKEKPKDNQVTQTRILIYPKNKIAQNKIHQNM